MYVVLTLFLPVYAILTLFPRQGILVRTDEAKLQLEREIGKVGIIM